MSAFWDIVADAVEDKVQHDHWCNLAVSWGGADHQTARDLGFRCDCSHGFAIAAIRKGPLS